MISQESNLNLAKAIEQLSTPKFRNHSMKESYKLWEMRMNQKKQVMMDKR